MKKNKHIEIIRGFLILMIVFFHYTYRFSQIYGISTLNFFSLSEWGTIGVGCFFIITGFFLIPKDFSNYDSKKFIMKKISRIYPAYVLCMTITFISVQIWGLELRETNWLDYLLNLTMINGLIDGKYVDGAHWYLTYLLIYYIIIGITLKFSRNSRVYLTIWILVKDIFKVVLHFFNYLNPVYRLIGGNYVEFIVIGIAFKQIIDRSNHYPSAKELFKQQFYHIGLITLSLIQIGIFCNYIVMASIILFLWILWKAVKNETKNIYKYDILYFLGGISYIVYLIHQNIGYQILLKIYNVKQVITICDILIVILIIIAISYIIDNLFEKKIHKRIDEKILQSYIK